MIVCTESEKAQKSLIVRLRSVPSSTISNHFKERSLMAPCRFLYFPHVFCDGFVVGMHRSLCRVAKEPSVMWHRSQASRVIQTVHVSHVIEATWLMPLHSLWLQHVRCGWLPFVALSPSLLPLQGSIRYVFIASSSRFCCVGHAKEARAILKQSF